MVILLLIACTTDASDSTGTVTGPQDLSGYATLEDLAALQEQVDQQADEIVALRDVVAGIREPQVTTATGCEPTGSGVLSITVTFDAPVRVLSIAVCSDVEYDDHTEHHCMSGFESSDAPMGGYGAKTYPTGYRDDGVVTSIGTYCDSSNDTIEIVYLPIE